MLLTSSQVSVAVSSGIGMYAICRLPLFNHCRDTTSTTTTTTTITNYLREPAHQHS